MMSTDDKDSLTTDIIARLRQEGSFPPYYGVPAIQNDAADEIERLRAENERLRKALNCLVDEQNGPPLLQREHYWREAMEVASAALEEKN